MSNPPISKIPKPWPGFKSISRAEYIPERCCWLLAVRCEVTDATQPHIGQIWIAHYSWHSWAGFASRIQVFDPTYATVAAVIPRFQSYSTIFSINPSGPKPFNTIILIHTPIPTKWPTFVREQLSKCVRKYGLACRLPTSYKVSRRVGFSKV